MAGRSDAPIQFKMRVTGINEIRQAVGRLPNDVERATLLGAKHFAAYAETKMKQRAPWTDRTTNARNGLFCDAEFTGGQVVVVFGHSVTYGKYLELAHGHKYAILE